MITLLLTIIAGLLFTGLVSGAVFVSRVYRRYENFKSELSDFFIVQDSEGSTQFSAFINAMTEAAAVRVGQNVQAGIRGSLGGTTKGLVNELEQEAINANPSLAGIKMLPKAIQKNPIAAMGAQMIFDKIFSGGSGGSGGSRSSGGNGSRPRFKL